MKALEDTIIYASDATMIGLKHTVPALRSIRVLPRKVRIYTVLHLRKHRCAKGGVQTR